MATTYEEGAHDEYGFSFLGKAITVKSQNGPDNCIIDCTHEGKAFVFGSGEGLDSVLEGFTIRNGSAMGPWNELTGRGGGIYCGGGSPTITDCVLTDNAATEGGGIYFQSSAALNRCTISGNTAVTIGGGIVCAGWNSPTITDCVISGNSVPDGKGGGLYCIGSLPVLANCIIAGNVSHHGGAIACDNASLRLINCTVTENSASWTGGGIWCAQTIPVILLDTILWGDTPQEVAFWGDGDPNTITVSYSDVQGGQEAIETFDNGTVNWEEGNIDADPLFVDPANGDYHLQAGSPCIDAGDPDSPLDPDETRADIGAFYTDQTSGPGGVIIVNSTDDPGTAGDDFVTLREAITFVRGRAMPSGGETAQVTGTPGAAFADTILFDTSVFPPDAPATIFVTDTQLLDTGNDVIDGSDAGVIVDGNSETANGFFITSNGNTIKGLQILDFRYNSVQIFNGARNNTIGGPDLGEGNVISGNGDEGIKIWGSGTRNNVVIGNYIGTDTTGTVALGNGRYGVIIFDGAGYNVIGGSTSGERNVISANSWAGITIGGDGNRVLGNYIGTDVTGTVELGNGGSGVYVSGAARYNVIGGATPGQGNLIAYNGGAGVYVRDDGTLHNTIRGNAITDNVGLGIALVNGGNRELPAPVITSVTETEVSGTVDGTKVPDGSVVEIFNDPMDEGETFLGSIIVGGGAFTFTGAIPTIGYITATVTDLEGNTSEFSYVELPPSVVSTTPDEGGVLDLADNILAIFSKGMDGTTLNPSTVLVSGTVSGTVAGNVGYEEWRNAVVFDPDAYLTVGESVTVTITGEVQDNVGRGLDGDGDGVVEGSPTDDYVWSFVVADVPPRVTQTFPSQDGIADPDIRITAAFDRGMDPGTLNASTFLVSGSGTGTMAGTVTYDVSSRSATFFPDASFVEGETVTVTLTGGVQKDTGVGLDGDRDGVAEGSPADDYTWSFVPSAPVLCVAYPTETSPEADGEIGPGEYRDTLPVEVNFDDPTTRPGIVPNWIAPPSDREDLSYLVYAMYDEEHLYMAVDVTDDVLVDDSITPYQDDCVEIWMDADEVANDFSIGRSVNREGGGVKIDVGGDIDNSGIGSYGTDWFGAVGTRPGGYVVEFSIPLSSIDMTDGEGEAHPAPGSSIGILFAVDDDDNGGAPYEQPDDSYGAWTGSYEDWLVSRESDWGVLHFSEPSLLKCAVGEVRARPGQILLVPVTVDMGPGDSVEFSSTDLSLTYDSDVVCAFGVSAMGTLSEDWLVEYRVAQGAGTSIDTIHIGLAASLDSVSSGTLIYIRAMASEYASPGDSSALVFERCAFNEGAVPVRAEDGMVRILAMLGDVSGNGEVSAYDASLVLQGVVGLITLPDPEWPAFVLTTADVTGNGAISALDASWILQYSVGIANRFPVERGGIAEKQVASAREIVLGPVETRRDGHIWVPVRIDEMSGVLSGEMEWSFDATVLKPVEVVTGALIPDYLSVANILPDRIRFCFAGAESGTGSGEIAVVVFQPIAFDGNLSSVIWMESIVLNEGKIPVRMVEMLMDLPEEYRLSQNYPNPFNPETTITYDVAKTGAVRLSVYALTGQLVRTLVDGERLAGTYSVTWDGTDDTGQAVASGVYLCRMIAGDYRAVRKLVLVR